MFTVDEVLERAREKLAILHQREEDKS
jgi:hypothetical protein